MNDDALNAPAITVIVPIYNVEDFVTQCLDSLRRQTFKDFECIVVDDGSTDSSRKRAEDAIKGDPRFRLIAQDNKGLSSARNVGLDQARGQAVAFVDGDDRVMSGFLAKMWDALAETNADWVACGIRFVFPDGFGHTHSGLHSYPDLANNTALVRFDLTSWQDVIGHFPSAWNKLYRRQLIDGLRFPEGRLFEDHEFFCKTASRTDHIVHLPEALYLQTREREGQITGADNDGVFQQFAVLDDLKDIITATDKPDAEHAFQLLAARLIFERTTALNDPERRKRYAIAARDYFDKNAIPINVDQMAGAKAYWPLEMAGQLPLTIILPVPENDTGGLGITLKSLRNSYLPAHEMLLAGTSKALSNVDDAPALSKVLVLANNTAVARKKALSQAQGNTVVFLNVGDRPDPETLADWVDHKLRTSADICVGQSIKVDGSPDLDMPQQRHDGSVQFVDAHKHPLSTMAFDRKALIERVSIPRLRDPNGTKLAARAVKALDKIVLAPEAGVTLNEVDQIQSRAVEDHVAKATTHPFDCAVPLNFAPATTLTIEADMRNGPYLNVSLLTSVPGNIPFHVSIRRDENLVVTNQRDSGQWNRERQLRADLPNGPITLQLDLTETGIEVLLDSKRISRFEISKKDRAEFETVIAADIHGATLSTSVQLRPATPNRLWFSQNWEVRASVSDTNLHIETSDQKIQLPTTTVDDDQDAQLSCLLPGRVWKAVSPEEKITLVLKDQTGRVVGEPTEIGKPDIAARINALATVANLRLDPFITTHIVEHVHFGKLWSLLVPEAQQFVQRLANDLGVQDSLPLSTHEDAQQPPPSIPHTDTAIDNALKHFCSAIGAKEFDGDTLGVVTDLPLPFLQRRGLFLALTEFFLIGDQSFTDLHTLAVSEKLDPHLTPYKPEDAWMSSVLLPWLLHHGRHWDAIENLYRLNNGLSGWMVAPAIAYCARFAITEPNLDPDIRRTLVSCVMRFIERQSRRYWGRAQCAELAKVAALMITKGPSVLPELRSEMQTIILSTYCMNKAFWTCIPKPDLPPALELAFEAFTTLTDSSGTMAAQQSALDQLERFGFCDVHRYRCELFGPAETPNAGKSHLTRTELLSRGARSGQIALRLAASPEHNVADDAIDIVRQEVIAGYSTVPQASAYETQVALGAELQDVIDSAGPTSKLPPKLIELLDRLEQADTSNLACAVALHCCKTLQDRGAKDAAHALKNWVDMHMGKGSNRDNSRSLALTTALNRVGKKLGTPSQPTVTDKSPVVPSGTLHPKGLHDAVVLVFSCQPYLDTRIAKMRQTWLKDLQRHDIPYLVVVGDGDNSVKDDVLYLECPDDYEGLPQKMLSALSWVYDNTSAGHVVKVDDDCFLNVPVWFGGLSYLKFDYYGRKLSRVPGQTDRNWHRKKSTSDRGRNELDKSPEPSEYADGGSAYALSRRAIRAALEQSKTAAGQRLIQVSFMEDKLLGDLLALSGISVAQEDYRVAIRRKTHATAVPVSTWLSSFFPSKAAPLSLIHLDSTDDQHLAAQMTRSTNLSPSKIWPTHHKPKLGYNSNALELLSPMERVDKARKASIVVVSTVRNEMFMLPHFLAHYRSLGVTSFLIADNLSDDGTREYLLEQSDVCLFSVDTDYSFSHYGVDWQQALLAAYRVGKWSLVADADELLVWQRPQKETLPQLVSRAEFSGIDAVRIFMLDMYPRHTLSEATFESADLFEEAGYVDFRPFHHAGQSTGPFSDQPGWVSALRHRLIPRSRPNLFSAQKLALLRYHPGLQLTEGLHFIGGAEVAERELLFAHFKYNAVFLEKAKAEVGRRQHFNNAEEYQRYLALVSEGRDIIYDSTVSVPWHSAPFVAERLLNSSE